MTKIKPIKLSLNKGTANEIYVCPIGIELYKDSCGSYWKLLNDGDVLDSGNMLIPSEIYLKWGEDDSVIENYVILELGVERAI